MSIIVEIETASKQPRVADLDRVKTELGITGTGEDADLSAVIDMVSAEFERLLERPPWYQEYKERRPGLGGDFLPLSRSPAYTPSLVRKGVDSPTTVTASDYEVSGSEKSRLYKPDGWALNNLPSHVMTSLDSRELDYEVTYYAGWACPRGDWLASKAKILGDWVSATDGTVAVHFECTTAGTTDTTEPTWNTTAGVTTADNDITWTARTVDKMPANLELAAIWAVKELYRDGAAGGPAGVAEEAFRSARIKYDVGGAGSDSFLPMVSAQVVSGYALQELS